MVLTPDAWRGSILADYSAGEEVYLQMWGEHGKGPWAGQQGGNQSILKTLSRPVQGAGEPTGRRVWGNADCNSRRQSWCLMPRVGRRQESEGSVGDPART